MHRLRLLTVILAAAALALIPDLLTRRPPSLLSKAREITSCPPDLFNSAMIWSDDHTIIARTSDYFIDVFDETSRSDRKLSVPSIRPYWDAPDTSISSLDNKAGGVSPDGRTLLWGATSGVMRFSMDGSGSTQVVTYPAAWLDQWKTKWSPGSGGGYSGSQSPSGNAPANPIPEPEQVKSMAWTADSRHWLSIDFSGASRPWLRLRDYDGHIVSQMQFNMPSDALFLRILGVVNRHTAILKVGPDSYIAVDMRHGLTLQRSWTIYRPTDYEQTILSPDGARLLWYSSSYDRSHSWLNNLTRRLSHSNSYLLAHSMAVSNLDGSHMREIGREESSMHEFMSVNWLSDSKHAMFTMNGKIWSIAL